MFSNWLAKLLKIQQLTLMSKEVQAHYWPSCFESNFFLCISSMLLSSFSFSSSSLLMAFASSPHFALFIEHRPSVLSTFHVLLERSLWVRLHILTHAQWCSSFGTRRMILLWLTPSSYSHIPAHWL